MLQLMTLLTTCSPTTTIPSSHSPSLSCHIHTQTSPFSLNNTSSSSQSIKLICSLHPLPPHLHSSLHPNMPLPPHPLTVHIIYLERHIVLLAPRAPDRTSTYPLVSACQYPTGSLHTQQGTLEPGILVSPRAGSAILM